MSFLGTIKHWVQQGKDSGTAYVLRRLVQNRVAEYGIMQDLKIDSLEKKVRLEILLKGEKESLTLTIDRYELVVEGLHTYFVVKNASASREWMNLLIQQFLIERRFLVPENMVQMVKIAL